MMDLQMAYIETQKISEKILSQDLSAYEGAMKIWKDILERLEQNIPDDLWSFKSNASAIQDCIADTEECGSNHTRTIQHCEKEIIDAARNIHTHI